MLVLTLLPQDRSLPNVQQMEPVYSRRPMLAFILAIFVTGMSSELPDSGSRLQCHLEV